MFFSVTIPFLSTVSSYAMPAIYNNRCPLERYEIIRGPWYIRQFCVPIVTGYFSISTANQQDTPLEIISLQVFLSLALVASASQFFHRVSRGMEIVDQCSSWNQHVPANRSAIAASRVQTAVTKHLSQHDCSMRVVTRNGNLLRGFLAWGNWECSCQQRPSIPPAAISSSISTPYMRQLCDICTPKHWALTNVPLSFFTDNSSERYKWKVPKFLKLFVNCTQIHSPNIRFQLIVTSFTFVELCSTFKATVTYLPYVHVKKSSSSISFARQLTLSLSTSRLSF